MFETASRLSSINNNELPMDMTILKKKNIYIYKLLL